MNLRQSLGLLLACAVATLSLPTDEGNMMAVFATEPNQHVMNTAQCVAFSETLVLGGVKRSITKVADQGNSAITYKVDGGWPDPTTNQDVTAYAKTGKTPGETFKSEIKWLQKTDQLLAEGKYGNHQWIVFHGVNDKMHLVETDFGRMLIEKYMHKGDVAGCSQEVEHKIDLIIKEAEIYVKKFGVLHGDVQPGNVFWDRAAKDPTLIDWGRAEEVAAGWTPAIANKVRQQAIYSHLKGDERICHDLKYTFADTLTLNGVTRPIIKVADQGNTAITYKVGGSGWPDPSVKRDVTAYAKSGKRSGQTHDDEIKWLTKIHELLAAGKFNNLNWIVFHGVDNKLHIVGTTYYHTILQQYLIKGDVQGCKNDFKLHKIPLIVKEAKFYVDKYKVLHTDIQPGNILWDMAATSPTLIDWGRAKDAPKWTPDIEKQVIAQAVFSHLEGGEQICVHF